MKEFKDLKFEPHFVGEGLMGRMDFENGYGVSVVRLQMPTGTYGSYTSNDDEWELAVFEDGSITYDTPITDDVLGHLSDSDVTDVMKRVQELKAP